MAPADFSLEKVVRPNIWNLAPYSCARDEFTGVMPVMLDANENAFGACLGGQADPLKLERYPDPKQVEVKEQLLAIRPKGLAPENLFLGVGSDEAIDLVIRVFCRPGTDKILQCPPTYGMYKVSAQTNDIEIVNVPLKEETYELDTEAVLAAVAADPLIKVLFVCSPNNPTGNVIHPDSITRLLQSFGGIVVVDEAYVDFADGEGWSGQVLNHPNLIVMQTFSKSFGLAAARLGMAYGGKPIIDIMNKVKAPYNVSSLAADAALKALKDGAAEMKGKVKSILEEKAKMEGLMAAVPCVGKVYPSASNFFLVKVADANKAYQHLASHGVIVRNRCTQPLCGGCLRITVGTPEENTAVLDALKSVPQ